MGVCDLGSNVNVQAAALQNLHVLMCMNAAAAERNMKQLISFKSCSRRTETFEFPL